MQRRIFTAAALMTVAAFAQAQTPGGTGSIPQQADSRHHPSDAHGGGTDFIGRNLATHLNEAKGWVVVPDNRPGAEQPRTGRVGARSRP